MALPLLALALLLGAPPAAPGPAAPAPAKVDPWSALRFLVGNWKAETGGEKPGEAVGGGFSFAIDLDGKVAIRRSRAEYAPAEPGCAGGPCARISWWSTPGGAGSRPSTGTTRGA